MKIDRYTPICEFQEEGHPEAKMLSTPQGGFVLYSDYQALEQRIENALNYQNYRMKIRDRWPSISGDLLDDILQQHSEWIKQALTTEGGEDD